MLDCIIVGGGPAGLSTALVLGRCRRRLLVCDADNPRNARATTMHGFLSRDGIPPREFLAIARSQLAAYSNIEFRQAEVVKAYCVNDNFGVALASGEEFVARTLVLATGVVDELPPLAGLDALYGRSVFHCPHCDGWEWRDRRLAVYGRGKTGLGLATMVSNWSRDLVLCTDGYHELTEQQLEALSKLGTRIVSERIERLAGADGQLQAIHFADGSTLERDAMFIVTHQRQSSPLASQLGCEDRMRRTVPKRDHQKTRLHGLYVVGDASRDVQMVIIAAAEGADAAFSINKYLLAQEVPPGLLD